MKTAISIPDKTFKAADIAARKLGISRSELYARAVVAYLDHLRTENVTERLDRVYADAPGSVDPLLSRLMLASLPGEKW